MKMKRRRKGTFTGIWAQISGHLDIIVRVVLWALLLVLAILAWNEPRGWWSVRTKIEYIGTAVLLILNVILTLRRRRTAATQNPTQTQPSAEPTTAPTLAQTVGMAAVEAYNAAIAAGATQKVAKLAAKAAAKAASVPATPPAPKITTPSHGTEIGRWYFGIIPFIRLPLILVRYRLGDDKGNRVVCRQKFLIIRDTESFSNIKNWDIIPDDAGMVLSGAATFRILPDKIGEKALEVWRFMPPHFALDLDEALTSAKDK